MEAEDRRGCSASILEATAFIYNLMVNLTRSVAWIFCPAKMTFVH